MLFISDPGTGYRYRVSMDTVRPHYMSLRDLGHHYNGVTQRDLDPHYSNTTINLEGRVGLPCYPWDPEVDVQVRVRGSGTGTVTRKPKGLGRVAG